MPEHKTLAEHMLLTSQQCQPPPVQACTGSHTSSYVRCITPAAVMAITYVISIAEHWTTWSATSGTVQFGKRSLDEAMRAVMGLAICEAAGPSSPRHINKCEIASASFCNSPLLALQVTDCASRHNGRGPGGHSAKRRGGGEGQGWRYFIK